MTAGSEVPKSGAEVLNVVGGSLATPEKVFWANGKDMTWSQTLGEQISTGRSEEDLQRGFHPFPGVEMLKQAWDATKPDGQPRRCLDTERAAELFDWRAQVGFEDGLRRTIDWFRANRAEIEAAEAVG